MQSLVKKMRVMMTRTGINMTRFRYKLKVVDWLSGERGAWSGEYVLYYFVSSVH